ncbi:hypothetical protein chiPu_0017494 [Chiloscyllium punctatum]|uniref:CCHC-type domain-containing protein n=1 Tax=Chiloscyllium punctatum TaxID=137246 RepID=A0A401RGG6_CHIPU|nr:hypothetical protein [Chiloscyllium punctatum]
MLRSGWRPADLLDAQREWWIHQKRDRYEKACILVLQAHVRLASKVQLYVQDKQKQASEHRPRRLPTVRSYRHYLRLQAPRRPPPGTVSGSWTTQAPGNHTRVSLAPPRLKLNIPPGVDTMKLLDRLPTLKPRRNNAEFWQWLREMQICHNFHNRDMAGLVQNKLPENLWSRLRPAHQNGSWCTDLSDGCREQEAALADFLADVSEALGHMPVDWNAIVAVTPKPGEGAHEYGARKFEAFQAHRGIPDADRQNPAFIQLYKDGLGPTHLAVLRTGLVPYVSFTEIENWAMSLDNQAPATVAALSTPRLLICHRCRQTGHYKSNCPLYFGRPRDPDAGQHRGRSPPRHAHRRRPSHPSEQGTPKQGTNGNPRPQKPHEPRSPTQKLSSPDWDQLSRGQLLELLQLLAWRKD